MSRYPQGGSRRLDPDVLYEFLGTSVMLAGAEIPEAERDAFMTEVDTLVRSVRDDAGRPTGTDAEEEMLTQQFWSRCSPGLLSLLVRAGEIRDEQFRGIQKRIADMN